jgi:hypothetical protein
MSDSKISDEGALIKELRDKLHNWKTEAKYPHPINLTLIPMRWKVEVGI